MKINVKVNDYLENNKDNMIADISELVKIRSFTDNIKEVRDALNYVLELAEKMGFKIMRTTTNDVGIVEMGEGEDCVGVLVHVDVVGIGDIEKWEIDPFECTVKNGYIWGRGTIDDKGPVILSLYAMKAIKDLGIRLNKKIWLIVGTSEEGVWTDMENLKKEFKLPNYGFSPDGEFPIYNIEKGYADIELFFFEPNRRLIEKLESGDSPNTIPSKAVIKLKGREEQKYNGISVHSSTPDRGINAIEKLCIDSDQENEFNFIRFIKDFFTKEHNGLALGLDDGTEYFKGQYVGKTSITPTILKLTDTGVYINLNIRQRCGLSVKEIIEAFNRKASEYSYASVLKESLEPMMVSEKQEHLQIMKKVCEDYGCDGSFKVADGASYAKAIENCVSWGPVFPEDESGAHEENERLSIDSMMKAAKMYTTYLIRTTSDTEKNNKLKEMTSLEKGLSILELFTEQPLRYNMAQIVKKTAMNRTTLYRNLCALENAGLITKDEKTKTYSLGPTTYRLGNVYLSNSDYQEKVYNVLEKIAIETKESVGLARRDGYKVVSIYAVEAHQSMKMNDRPGTFYPMNKGTFGKGLMAYHEKPLTSEILDKYTFEKTAPNTLTETDEILTEYTNIRKQGYVLSIEETHEFIVGVGVPIRGLDKRYNNLVAVSFFKQKDYLEKIELIKDVLFKYKEDLEKIIK
ncbi:MAG: M20/M25/M40 family metallo-hydrolase [Peptostreptococcaceae bacterium]|nr:M20/M25/M40 family metallo-hydrolase [Peptostreptococcaceae bacterium]